MTHLSLIAGILNWSILPLCTCVSSTHMYRAEVPSNHIDPTKAFTKRQHRRRRRTNQMKKKQRQRKRTNKICVSSCWCAVSHKCIYRNLYTSKSRISLFPHANVCKLKSIYTLHSAIIFSLGRSSVMANVSVCARVASGTRERIASLFCHFIHVRVPSINNKLNNFLIVQCQK